MAAIARTPSASLERRDPRAAAHRHRRRCEPQVAFLFPGLGDQYAGMARGLYATTPGSARGSTAARSGSQPLLGLDLREVLFRGRRGEETEGAEPGLDLRAPAAAGDGRGRGAAEALLRADRGRAAGRLRGRVRAGPARLLDWGIRPQAMVGYSLGEYVAACLAGVLSLDDALAWWPAAPG